VKEAQSGWYLVYTKPRHENLANIHLQNQGFHVYFPLLQQHKRRHSIYRVVTEPLFPRYLFIHLNSGIDDWSKIRSTRGCVSLVRFGPIPAKIPDSLILRLQEDEIHRFSKQQNTPDFKPGDRVQVIDGILENYEGIIETKNNQERVTLLLNIAEGYTRRVQLPVHQIVANES
jgi:transcriptional antiterminator RfaH